MEKTFFKIVFVSLLLFSCTNKKFNKPIENIPQPGQKNVLNVYWLSSQDSNILPPENISEKKFKVNFNTLQVTESSDIEKSLINLSSMGINFLITDSLKVFKVFNNNKPWKIVLKNKLILVGKKFMSIKDHQVLAFNNLFYSDFVEVLSSEFPKIHISLYSSKVCYLKNYINCLVFFPDWQKILQRNTLKQELDFSTGNISYKFISFDAGLKNKVETKMSELIQSKFL